MNRKRAKSKIDRTMPMVHPNAAAIDIGATMHMAAVRADRAPEPDHARLRADLWERVDELQTKIAELERRLEKSN